PVRRKSRSHPRSSSDNIANRLNAQELAHGGVAGGGGGPGGGGRGRAGARGSGGLWRARLSGSRRGAGLSAADVSSATAARLVSAAAALVSAAAAALVLASVGILKMKTP